MSSDAPSLFPLTVMGVRVDLELSGTGRSEVEEAVASAWDRCRAGADAVGEAPRRVRVVLDPEPATVSDEVAVGAVAGSTLIDVMDALTSRLVQVGLEAVIGDRLLLHAGALADPITGATAVLVAPSGTGKTTASQTLARQLGYVTDETTVIDRDGSITSFPKPLSLLVNGARPKTQVSPTQLEMLPAPPQPWLARIAYLKREAGTEGVRTERVPVLEALTLLAEQTSSLHLLREPLGSLAGLLEAQGGLVRLVYSEAADLLPVIQGWLAQAERLEIPLPDHSGEATAESASGQVALTEPSVFPRVRRLPVIDEVVRDTAMAVMVPGQVIALSSLAAFVLLEVGDAGEAGIAEEALVEMLAAEVPAPGSGSVAAALAPILDDLQKRGLLERL